MMILLLTLCVLVLLPPLYVILQYNALITLRNHIRESWSDVDTELKRRYDLIPNLIATVQGYASHEQAVLERVTELRNRCLSNQVGRSGLSGDEQLLVDNLRQLLVVVESYPELKADAHFRQLQEELVLTENRIQAARRFYNGNVRDYRNKSDVFPGNLIASVFNFGAEEFFTVESSVRDVPETKF
jgi:LemA protein